MIVATETTRVPVGFIATPAPLTPEQRAAFINFACSTPMSAFHLTDTVGADEDAIGLLCELGGGGVVHTWPGAVPAERRAHLAEHWEALGIVEHPVMQAHNRVRAIVEAVAVVVVAYGTGPRRRSEPAIAAAHAARLGKPIVDLGADGA